MNVEARFSVFRQERVSPPGFHRAAGTVAGCGFHDPFPLAEPLRLLL
jgi:hypothetical protein